MYELAFYPLHTDRYRLYTTWFRDPELARRIETPTRQWLHYVTTTPGVYAWLIYPAMRPVGQMQLDTTPQDRGSIALAVNPAL